MRETFTSTTMRKALLLCAAVLCGAASQASGATSESAAPAPVDTRQPGVVRIGTTYGSLSFTERKAISQTFLYLSKRLPQYKFEIRDYAIANLEGALKRGEMDLFLASSGFYRRVFHRGLRDLVTLTTPTAPNPDYAAGSLFVVRKDSPYERLDDLRDARAAVSWDEGFTGYFLPRYALRLENRSPDNFFSRYVFGGSPAKRLMESLLEDRADVAFVRACTYEELTVTDPEFAAKFRAVHVRPDEERGFRCMTSTPLLPNWTIVSTSLAPWQVSRDVSVALLSMPPTTDGYAWGVVSDFARVDDMYRALKEGPYAYLRVRSLQDFILRYWPFLLIGLMTVLGLALHSWRTGVLVRKRTRELQAVIHREREAQQLAQEERRQKQLLEQVSVIGAMSSLITHELNAPLNAIATSTRSLERFFENDPPPAVVVRALTLIRKQCERASEIVGHVRSYVKRREIVHEPVNLGGILASTVSDRKIKHPDVEFRFEAGDEPVIVLADALEIELLFTNLIKNAVDALKDTSSPCVGIGLKRDGNRVVASVRDNAASTRPGDELLFNRPRIGSSKTDGLGLGLLIVRAIAERHAGHVEVFWADPGLRFEVTLPAAPEANATTSTNSTLSDDAPGDAHDDPRTETESETAAPTRTRPLE